MTDFKELQEMMNKIPGLENFKMPDIDLKIPGSSTEWSMIPVRTYDENEKELFEVLHISNPELIDEVISLGNVTSFSYKDSFYNTNLSVKELSKIRFKN